MKVAIAKDYLARFTSTGSISRYSPRASLLAQHCKLKYPTVSGGRYDIKIDDVLVAATALNLIVKTLSNGDAQIGISAKEVKLHRSPSVFNDAFVCKHGFAPITYVMGSNPQIPIQKACCERCSGGHEPPDSCEVSRAMIYLQGNWDTSCTLLLVAPLEFEGHSAHNRNLFGGRASHMPGPLERRRQPFHP
jgi:hypothetical protein